MCEVTRLSRAITLLNSLNVGLATKLYAVMFWHYIIKY